MPPERMEEAIRALGREPRQRTTLYGAPPAERTRLSYGAPPHGGVAPGVDRIIMMMAGEEAIRDVIAFPKNANAVDLMTDAPSPVDPAQLTELHVQVIAEPEKGTSEQGES